MNKIKRFLLLMFLCFVLSANTVKAQNAEELKKEYQDNCKLKWQKGWAAAKEGNLMARSGMAFSIMPLMHMNRLSMPGRGKDIISNYRDYVILSVHSEGKDFSKGAYFEEWGLIKTIERRLLRAPFSREEAENYIQCLRDKEPENRKSCVDQAIEDQLVPPFDVYAKEIDALIAQGYEPTCHIDLKSSIGSKIHAAPQ